MSHQSTSQDDLPPNVGKLTFQHEIVRKKKDGEQNKFYCGTFDEKLQIKVFVRRVNMQSASTKQELERDRVACLLTGAHENIIRYYFIAGADFHYFVTEWCVLSVEDLFDKDEGKKEIKDKIWNSLTSKDILLQATKGLVFLHSFDFVHRNIKPSNVLIAQDKRNPMRYVVKLSDFRTAKNLQDPTEQVHSGAKGSDGWIAPYPNVDGIQTDPKEDVFILGCFYYYVLDVNHRHPFGNNATSRNMNIYNKESHVYHPEWKTALPQDQNKPESQAIALIKDMIKFDPEDRPSLETILDRAYFLPDNYYKLYDVPDVKPGLCVIFNQEKFNPVKEVDKTRYGTEEDKKALKDVFINFGFDVEHHDDLTAQQLLNEINNLTMRDFSNYACLVVCILSHGKEGTVAGTDWNPVSIEKAKKQFNNYNCPSLIGKPKIWIIQACQGNQLQEDLENLAGHNNSTFQPSPHDTDSQSIYSQLPDIPRPPVSDILDIRASVPGFVSFRNKTGSTLIRNLCNQLRTTFLEENTDRLSNKRHLEDLLKMVQKFIRDEKIWLPATKEDEASFKDFIKRVDQNIDDIIKSTKGNKENLIARENNKFIMKEVTEDDDLNDLNKRTEVKWEWATSEDIKENPEMKLTFGKTYDDKSKKWIFKQRCQQTIEWRSTLIDFIRFEKKASSTEHSQNAPVASN